MPSAMADLVAPVTVAEIELQEPAIVTHLSVAPPGGSNSEPRALVLVRLRGVPVGTIVVEAPAGKVAGARRLLRIIFRLPGAG